MRVPRSLSLLVLLGVVASGWAAAPAISSHPKTVDASIRENGPQFSFRPRVVTIHRGDSVRWRWCPATGGCSSAHNVVGSLNGKTNFKSPRNASATRGVTSGSYSRRFMRAGTYQVVCLIHGFSMKVKVS
jgi:plastocyanin